MKILVTGGSGLVGKHLKKILPDAIYITSKDYDLTNENDVRSMFLNYTPDVVVHLAAKVGGILDNIKNPATFFTDNIKMNTLMIEYSQKSNVKQFIGILSTCIYPDVASKYPMTENMLHEGSPTETNFSYGYSKRCMAVQIDAYNKQYGTNYQYLIPCNLYGEEDKDDEEKSHFLTALIKKISEAKRDNKDTITLFGDGSPLRQYMYAGDLAKIIKEIIDKKIYQNMNISTEENISIKEIFNIVKKVLKSENIKVEWDITKPNGQYRKDVSIDKLKSILPDFKFTSLTDGIKKVYKTYND